MQNKYACKLQEPNAQPSGTFLYLSGFVGKQTITCRECSAYIKTHECRSLHVQYVWFSPTCPKETRKVEAFTQFRELHSHTSVTYSMRFHNTACRPGRSPGGYYKQKITPAQEVICLWIYKCAAEHSLVRTPNQQQAQARDSQMFCVQHRSKRYRPTPKFS